MKQTLLTLFFLLVPFSMMADEEITRIYKKIEIESEAIAVNRWGRTLEDVKYILVEADSRDIQSGTYQVEVSREETHIYHIEGTDIYLKLPYCLDWASRKKATLTISTMGFHSHGTLTWVKD